MGSNYITLRAPCGRHRREIEAIAPFQERAHRLGPRPRRQPPRGDRLRRGLLRRARPHAARSACCRAPDAPADADAVVISHALWQQRFGGALDVIGKPLRLGQRTYTIVAVAAARLRRHRRRSGGRLGAARGPRQDRELEDDRGLLLRPAGACRGCGPASIARARRSARQPGLQRRHRASTTGRHGRPAYRIVFGELPPARRRCGSRRRSVLLAVAAVSVLVLLMACGNVGNLLILTRPPPGSGARAEGGARRHAAVGCCARCSSRRVLLAAASPAPAHSSWCSPSASSCDGSSCRRSRRPPRRSTRASWSSPSAICGAAALVLGLVPAIRLTATRVHSARAGRARARRRRGSLDVVRRAAGRTVGAAARRHRLCSRSACGRRSHVDFGQEPTHDVVVQRRLRRRRPSRGAARGAPAHPGPPADAARRDRGRHGRRARRCSRRLCTYFECGRSRAPRNNEGAADGERRRSVSYFEAHRHAPRGGPRVQSDADNRPRRVRRSPS